jgi:hypothetical protein
VALQEIELVVWVDPWPDDANKEGEIQREWEHGEGEEHRKSV